MLKRVTGVVLIVIGLGVHSGCRAKKTGMRVDYTSAKSSQVVVSSAAESPMLVTCPAGMVLVPNGPMLYGPAEEKGGGAVEAEQRVSMKAFCIDKFEYPNQPGEAPLRAVSWLEAKNLCANKGKGLCSEQEFEKACRGPSGTRYTYGDGYAEGACPAASQDYVSGKFGNCVSGFGAQDMGGGVYEWTSSVPPGADSELRILRGGLSEANPALSSRCTYRVRYAAASSGREVGFRCCAATNKEELSK